MNRYDQQYLEFVNMFVDRVTVRPFLDDLLRLKRTMAMFNRLPAVERPKDKSTVAA
jgi:hypothetical protein